MHAFFVRRFTFSLFPHLVHFRSSITFQPIKTQWKRKPLSTHVPSLCMWSTVVRDTRNIPPIGYAFRTSSHGLSPTTHLHSHSSPIVGWLRPSVLTDMSGEMPMGRGLWHTDELVRTVRVLYPLATSGTRTVD